MPERKVIITCAVTGSIRVGPELNVAAPDKAREILALKGKVKVAF